MFGVSVGTFAQIALDEVPELISACNVVSEIAMSDVKFEQSISLLASGEQDSVKRIEQVKFEYVRFVMHLIARAEATGAESDEDLLSIYLALERARFADELIGDLIVPIALTALKTNETFQITEDIWIEPIDADMQRARAEPILSGDRVSALVVAAATHAVVVRNVKFDNRDYFDRRFRRNEIDLNRVDRVIQCLHIATARDTGYAQAYVRPVDWADEWEHDLPAIWKIAKYHRYPDEFDAGGWNEDKVAVSQALLDEIPVMFTALESSPANVQLAARRAMRAVLRDDDEDKTLDATIGMEALLLSNNDREEMTHRMAQRAAAALTADYPPQIVYGLVKKVYEHRSKIVHGRVRKTSMIRIEEVPYPAQDIAALLLRLLLGNLLRSENPWTPEQLDLKLLQALNHTAPTALDSAVTE
ncbi:hypothetical protein E3N86_04605 [Cryobacterium sp. Hz7]|uniref:HEPN domain-containing protein n=1 Tax=Cryobacterium sp. Hz7 TaxID=1259166 RepID=UPI00106CCC09|nr:HEPN domain-containing protein [Cryobacterium sp. Hz7]TFB63465.1 hypothetical protein E3N86_04605 [Cryobacterium sp. Hz7]